jgi:hypothetical protein
MSEPKDEKEPRLLPVAILNGREFFVDVENRLFRNFTNPDEIIRMHSEQGRQMVKDMQGIKWCCHGLFAGTDEAEV